VEPPVQRSVPPLALLLAAAVSALLVLVCHGANLRYLARANGCESALLLCPTEEGPWASGDLKTYHRVARDIGERGLLGGLGGALWVAVQSLRPTFFALPLLLPALLWKRGASPRYASVSLALWLASLAVPAFVVASNRIHHGVAVPSQVLANNLACYAVSRLEHERGLGEFDAFRWSCIEHFQRMPPHERVPAQMAYARKALLEKPAESLGSFLRELRVQALYPLHVWDVPKREALYPGWMQAGPGWLLLFWGCAAAGLAVQARRDPGLALFLALAWLLVMLPATTSHFAGDRLRFPLDVLCMPVALAFLGEAAGALRSLATRLATRAAGPRP
jgi:hypothetical protein